MADPYTINADDPLLKIDDVMKRVQISQAEIYRRMKAGDFPPPVEAGTPYGPLAGDLGVCVGPEPPSPRADDPHPATSRAV